MKTRVPSEVFTLRLISLFPEIAAYTRNGQLPFPERRDQNTTGYPIEAGQKPLPAR